MSSETRDRLEAEIRRLTLRHDIEAATTVALRGYGGEIFSFLLGFHKTQEDASDVFSIFSERVWKGLPSFDWASSFRTWAYTIARNASITYRVGAAKRAKRFQALPEGSQIAEVAEAIRSETRSYLKTEVKERVAQLREALSPQDQMLLTLRVDRRLPWLDLARILRDDDEPPTAEQLKRESAKLRQRFQAIKERLVALGKREGLMSSEPRSR